MDLESYFQSDYADEQSEITNILGDIGHIIDCLLRLSITIRNPARHDQFNSRVGVDIVSSYTQWDINHIREKFSQLDSKLVDRLAMAMSRRRQYIKYREEHSKKLAHGLLDEPGEGENATTIASSIPKRLKDEENAAMFTKMDALLDNMSEVSGTSYANSNAATNELRVPSIPKEYTDGPFLCPICHTLIVINDRNSWKYAYLSSMFTPILKTRELTIAAHLGNMCLGTYNHTYACSTIVHLQVKCINVVKTGWHI